MAVNFAPRFNAVHRYQAGWLNPASTLVNVPHSTSINLTSASLVTSNDTALALIRVVRSGVMYWISLRTKPATGNKR